MEAPAESGLTLNSDSPPKQESQHENPIEKNRRQTDKCFMFVVFLPIIAIWLVICIAGFFATREEDKQGQDKELLLWYINAPVTKLSVTLPISLLTCTVVICLCLFLYERFTKIFIYISCMTIILVSIASCFHFLRPMAPSVIDDTMIRSIEKIIKNNSISVSLALVCVLVIYALPSFIYTVIRAFSFLKADIRILCEITKYSCWLILHSPCLLLFSALITIASFLIISFILNSLVFDSYSDRSKPLLYVFLIVIIIGGKCVIDFIDNFARMVISEYTINKFWMKDEKISIVQSAMKIFKYHMGTAMFASTTIVSFISAIIQALKHKPSWRRKEHYIFYIVTKIALVTTPDSAIIFSSIYGTSFMKSYKKTFDTVLRSPTTYMAMLLVIQGMFFIINLALTVPVVAMIWAKATKDNAITPDLSRVVYGVLYSYLTFELLITSIMKAQLVNKL